MKLFSRVGRAVALVMVLAGTSVAVAPHVSVGAVVPPTAVPIPGIIVPGADLFSDQFASAYDALGQAWSNASSSGDPNQTSCTSVYVAPCQAVEGARLTSTFAPDGKHVDFRGAGGRDVATQSVLGLCTGPEDRTCVVGLTVSSAAGSETASYTGDLVAGTPFTGDITKGIPDGKYAPLFSAPGHPPVGLATMKNATQYVVRVRIDGNHSLVNCSGARNAGSAYCREKRNWVEFPTSGNTGALVDCSSNVPADLRSYCRDKERWQRLELGVRRILVDVFAVSPVMKSTVAAELPEGYSFEVTFRVSDEVAPRGWMSGRIGSPTLRQTRLKGAVEIAVGGEVSEVLGMATNITCATVATLPQAQIDAINKVRTTWAKWDSPNSPTSDPVPSDTCSASAPRTNNPPILASMPSATNGHIGTWARYCPSMRPAGENYMDTGINECGGTVSFADIVAAQGDRVSHVAHRWSVQSSYHGLWGRTEETFALDRCAGDSLAGVVGSNATMFDELPRIDGQTGQLEYLMAAPHYGIDGTSEAVGKYSLTVTKALAACQWGVNPAATSFTAKIVEGSTEQQQAQVSVQSDAQVFRISVTGFHFSSPRAKVAAKDKTKVSVRSVRVRPGRRIELSKVAKSTSTTVSTWFLTSGKCRMSANRMVIRMAGKGTCTATLSRYNVSSKRSSRQTILLRP